ncbi:RES family NAD+ phosphorylase [Falsiroseomonas sp. HW251]|uniref:RES family NAD+ phosphorylase n=1 Tax=Falsiroseomonas sp. HW251 TaxID=3390998 RepID=UPI003D321927
MQLFRLGTAAHPVWDGAGAAAHGGRWNAPGQAVIYAAGSLALAMLERLVQRRGFGATLVVTAEVPDDVAFEDLLAAPPGGWRSLASPSAVAAGAAWIAAGRTALLRVPSAVVPREANFVVNPAHPDAARIRVGRAETLDWDPRLFGIPAPRR